MHATQERTAPTARPRPLGARLLERVLRAGRQEGGHAAALCGRARPAAPRTWASARAGTHAQGARRAAGGAHANESVGAGSQTSMKSATSAMMMLAATKSSSLEKFLPRLVYSALLLVKMPMPTCGVRLRSARVGAACSGAAKRRSSGASRQPAALHAGRPAAAAAPGGGRASMPTLTKKEGSASRRSRKPLRRAQPRRQRALGPLRREQAERCSS